MSVDRTGNMNFPLRVGLYYTSWKKILAIIKFSKSITRVIICSEPVLTRWAPKGLGPSWKQDLKEIKFC